jgi:phage minor structural protein
MTPVLFDANETQFNSMGIGALADMISCLVHEARNGAFELTLEYPVDAPLFAELTEDRIIKAKANDNANMDPQLFRVYKSGKPLNGQCTFYAEHITGELSKNPITHVSVTNGTAQQFGQSILSNTVYAHRFTFVSGDTTVASSDLLRVPAAQALVGIEGSLVDRWRGELTRDNFVIREEQNRGEDTGIIIEYGKNLTDASQEKAIDETYTSIYPYATVQVAVGEGDSATTESQVIELPEKVVESPYVGNYAYGRCLPIDLSGDDVTDEASLRSKAQVYVNQSDFGKPKVTLTINFIQLWQTEEYKNIAPLEHVNLCDWVTVRFKKIGIDAKVKVVDGVFDSKAEKWISMELGDAKTDWQSSVQSSIDATNAIAQQAIQYAGQAIINADGTITFYSPTEPTGNIKTGSMWFKLVNGDYTEMWRYNGVSWDRIKSKDANDALNAANQAMVSANGKVKVWRQAAEPTEGMKLNDMWFRSNADGTETTFIYDGTKWDDPTDSGVKAAQDQADTAVATADAASAQASNALNTANSASGQAAVALNTANAANSAAIAAQQTAGDAATQASNAWNKAQDAWDEAQTKADTDNVYTKEETDQALTGYASTTTVNTLTGRVDQAETAISENENEISLKADASTVNTLSGRVSTAEATLTTQANQIAARITSQDADAKYATQTALTATSSSLTSQISSVQTNFTNLQVGGTNLIPNSDFSQGWVTNDPNYQNAGMYNCSDGSFTCDSNGFSGSATPSNNGSTGFIRVNIGGADLYSFFKDNQYIWQSFNSYYTNCRATLTISRWQSGWGGLSGIGDLNERTPSFLEGESSTSVARFTLTVYAQDQTKPFSFSMSKIKAETGNKCTDWSNASFDMATAVQFTSLSQTLTGFQTTVQQDYATKSLVTQTATSLQSSIDGKVGTDVYNSKMSQLSNDINLRVSKNDVVNQINISTESILIAGNKVHITGQTTIDNAVIQSAMIAALDAGKITTGYLDTNRLAAKSVTADKMDVANLAAISADIGWVTSGTINAVNVNGGTITGSIINAIGTGMDNATGHRAQGRMGQSYDNAPLTIWGTDQDIRADYSQFGVYVGDNRLASTDGYYDAAMGYQGAISLRRLDSKSAGNVKNWSLLDTSHLILGTYSDTGNYVGVQAYGTGDVYATGKLRVGNRRNWEGGASITLAIDDDDTGLDTNADGAMNLVSNSQFVAGITPDRFLTMYQGTSINDFHVGASVVLDNAPGGTNALGHGNDLSGLSNGPNNVNIYTWNGFSISTSIANQNVPQWNPAFSVDARQGDVWAARDYHAPYGWMYANNFSNNSRVELKQDITALDDNIGLSLVNSLDIYKFKYKEDVKQNRDKFIYGGIIGDGYNAPEEFMDFGHTGMNLYSSTFIGLKAIQELTALHKQDILKIANLESAVATQQQQINDLAQQNNDLRDRVQLLEAA